MNSQLSICIPSFNRRNELIETLDLLIPQARPHDIAIYISDNCSTDDTVEAVRIYARDKYPLIFINRNDRNLGFDRNLLAAISLSSSEYVWLLPDDDHPKADAISRILAKLNVDYSLVVLNVATGSKDPSRIIEERRLPYLTDREYLDSTKLEFVPIAHHITYLGSIVILRELSLSVDPSEFLDSGWVHCWIVLNCIIGRKTYVIAEPVINTRAQNNPWAVAKFEILYVNTARWVWSLPKNYATEFKERLSPQFPERSIKMILGAKAAGWIDKKNYESIFASANSGPPWKQRLVKGLVCYVPRSALQLAAVAYLRVKMLTDRENRSRYSFQVLEILDHT